MKKINIKFVLLLLLMMLCRSTIFSQAKYTLSTMPRVDVHAHVGGLDRMVQYMEVRKILKISLMKILLCG
jgi:hypothetical protein